MAMLNLIEFLDPSGEIIVSRIPPEGSGEFRLGSQLVVQESQSAYFYRDGQCLDGFAAGRHTLTTQNLPLLTKLIAVPFGGKSPFRAYVYFLALKTFTNLGWGTPTPVLFRDADLRMVTLRAHGMYSVRIVKARTFLNTIVGTKGMETTFAVQDFFRQIIVAKMNEVIGRTLKSILDLPVEYSNIANRVKEEVRIDFEQYGVQLADLVIEAITVPPEVQAKINLATGVAAQDTQKYKDIAVADALRDAARNTGGTGAGLGAGLGVGMGFGLAKQMSDNLAPPPPAVPTGSAPAPAVPGTDVKSKLRELKEMVTEGLITEAEFNEAKRKLLSQI